MLVQGQLILRGIVRRAVPTEGPTVAVFVHGVLAAGPVFDPLRKRVTDETGLATLDFTYSPWSSFSAILDRFSVCIERNVPKDAKLVLVGHSLGGLIARWYVQELGHADRVERLVTIATPHSGTVNARFAPLPVAPALLPGSSVIQRLAATADVARAIPHTTIVAGEDRLVAPLASAASAPFATVRWVPEVGHNEVLFHRRVHDLVIEALAGEV